MKKYIPFVWTSAMPATLKQNTIPEVGTTSTTLNIVQRTTRLQWLSEPTIRKTHYSYSVGCADCTSQAHVLYHQRQGQQVLGNTANIMFPSESHTILTEICHRFLIFTSEILAQQHCKNTFTRRAAGFKTAAQGIRDGQ